MGLNKNPNAVAAIRYIPWQLFHCQVNSILTFGPRPIVFHLNFRTTLPTQIPSHIPQQRNESFRVPFPHFSPHHHRLTKKYHVFPHNRGMLRRSRCVLIFLEKKYHVPLPHGGRGTVFLVPCFRPTSKVYSVMSDVPWQSTTFSEICSLRGHDTIKYQGVNKKTQGVNKTRRAKKNMRETPRDASTYYIYVCPGAAEISVLVLLQGGVPSVHLLVI